MQFIPIASSMGVSTLRSNTSRQSPYLQIDDPVSHPSQRHIYPSPSSPSLSSARASSSRSVTPPVNTHICSVLCMYDFHSDDPDHLPFAKNEILDVVKQGDNGWWAALRKGGRVGWIPEAFVNTLSAEVAEKLRNTREELRIYEYDAEQLYTSAPTRRIHHLSDTGEGSSSSSTSSRHDVHDNMNQTSRRRIHAKRHSPSASDPDPSSHSMPQRIQRSRDEPPPSYPSHLPRSASSNLTPSLSTNQKVASSQTRDRAGSLPTRSRSFKQRSIPVNEFSGSTRPSMSKESSDTNDVPKIASTPDDGSSDILVKRSRSQKLKQAMGFVDTRSRPAEPQSAVPWALQPAYPEEIVTDSNGIIWGSLDALVNKLTTGGLTRDPIKVADETKYRNAFLMTFHTFTTADTLFNMLIQRYRMETPDDLTIAEFQEWRTHAIAIQRSVFTIFTMWLEDHRLLEEEPHIAQRMIAFLRLIVMPPLSAMAQNLMQTIERLTFTTPGDASPKTPRRRRKPYPHKNDLLKLYTTDVAEQLTLFEFKLYARVTPQECIRHTTTPSTRSDSDLFVFCSTHDKLAAWVKTSILNRTALGKRADTVDFWIKIAEKCKQLNNLSTMSAVINALSSTVISSLTLTWAYVGRKSTLDGLLRHNEPTGGFSGYRNLLQNVDGPCVPFIGMYLTDLVHVQDQFSDEGGRICFFQKLKWYETVSAMLRYQSKPYDIHENDTTLKFIEEHLRENYNKDPNWFWSRSQEIQETEITDADLRKGLEAAGF